MTCSGQALSARLACRAASLTQQASCSHAPLRAPAWPQHLRARTHFALARSRFNWHWHVQGQPKNVALNNCHCPCRQARGSCALRCSAGMGIGFLDEAEEQTRPELLLAESGIRVPKAAYGLSLGQMAALGLAGGEMALKMGEPSPVRRACNCVEQTACLVCIFERSALRRCARSSSCQKSCMRLCNTESERSLSFHKAMTKVQSWGLKENMVSFGRSPCEPRRSTAEMRCQPRRSRRGWRLALAQRLARRRQTCHPCSWMDVSATSACRWAASQGHHVVLCLSAD